MTRGSLALILLGGRLQMGDDVGARFLQTALALLSSPETETNSVERRAPMRPVLVYLSFSASSCDLPKFTSE